jgi:hypothetical protein
MRPHLPGCDVMQASENRSDLASLSIPRRQQFVDPVDLVVGDAAEHIGEPGHRTLTSNSSYVRLEAMDH